MNTKAPEKKGRFRANATMSERSVCVSGFTLVEMMIVVGITGFVLAGMTSFFIQFYTISFVNEQRNQINKDIRQLTGELTNTGRQANYFTMYDSIAVADRNTAGDRRTAGFAGDLLVFVYTANDNTGDITRLECYYRDNTSADVDALAPVRHYTLDIPSGSSSTVEALIPDLATLQTGDEVVELSKGLSNGRLFFNFWGKSIMVNGQIYHGNDAKRVTETYNFSISPRG